MVDMSFPVLVEEEYAGGVESILILFFRLDFMVVLLHKVTDSEPEGQLACHWYFNNKIKNT